MSWGMCTSHSTHRQQQMAVCIKCFRGSQSRLWLSFPTLASTGATHTTDIYRPGSLQINPDSEHQLQKHVQIDPDSEYQSQKHVQIADWQQLLKQSAHTTNNTWLTNQGSWLSLACFLSCVVAEVSVVAHQLACVLSSRVFNVFKSTSSRGLLLVSWACRSTQLKMGTKKFAGE